MRGRTPPLRVTHVDSLAEVDAGAWDALLGENDFYCSHAWLQSLEPDRTVATEYLLAHRGDELVGGLPVYDVGYEFNYNYRPDRYRRLLGLEGDFLLAGTRFAYRNALPVAGFLAPAESRTVVEALLGAALETAEHRDRAGVVWLYLPLRAVEALQALAPLSVALETPEAELAVDELDGDGIPARLSSRRRWRIRKEIAAYREAGWTTAVEQLDDCAAPARLLANVQRKYEHVASERSLERFLLRQRAFLGDSTLLFTCRDEARELVAYSLMHRWRDALFARVVGIDYDRLRSSFEYFNVLFYEPVRYMVAQEIPRLHLGIGSLQAKVFRGATVRPLWSVAATVGATVEPTIRNPKAIGRWRNELRSYQEAFAEEDWRLPDACSSRPGSARPLGRL